MCVVLLVSVGGEVAVPASLEGDLKPDDDTKLILIYFFPWTVNLCRGDAILGWKGIMSKQW